MNTSEIYVCKLIIMHAFGTFYDIGSVFFSFCFRFFPLNFYLFSSHIERGKRRLFEYGINAYCTGANPRFNLGTPAGWTEKLTTQSITL